MEALGPPPRIELLGAHHDRAGFVCGKEALDQYFQRQVTALIEQAGCLGGAATIRNVFTYCGLYTLGEETRQAVAGIASELLGKLRRLGAVTPPVRHRGVFVIFDPEAVKRSLRR